MDQDGRRQPSMARGKELQGEGCQEVNAMSIWSLQDNEEDIHCGIPADLPQLMKIHNVFHVDLLSPYKEIEAYGTPYMRPPPDIKEGKEEYEVEAILDMRYFG
jgi:hypothetical protein